MKKGFYKLDCRNINGEFSIFYVVPEDDEREEELFRNEKHGGETEGWFNDSGEGQEYGLENCPDDLIHYYGDAEDAYNQLIKDMAKEKKR